MIVETQPAIAWRRYGSSLVASIEGGARPFAFITHRSGLYELYFPFGVRLGRRILHRDQTRLVAWVKRYAGLHARHLADRSRHGSTVLWHGGDVSSAYLPGHDVVVATIRTTRSGYVLRLTIAEGRELAVHHSSRYRLSTWAERFIASHKENYLALVTPRQKGPPSAAERYFFDAIWENYVPASRLTRY
jgi:hypothetical protein